MLTKLGDVNIHGACVEIVVINPDGLQGEVSLENLVGMAAEKGEKFILLGGQLGLLVTQCEQLLLGVEDETSDLIDIALLGLLATNATED